MYAEHPLNMKQYDIIQRGERSWWVSASTLGNNGMPLPYGRLVYFARNAEQARAWVARNSQPEDVSVR
jgi:hypothetical protein